MKKRLIYSALCCLTLLLAACRQDSEALLKELKANPPADHVYDQVGLFSSQDRAELSRFLFKVGEQTDAVIVVTALRSLRGDDIDGFASRLFEAWGIGQHGSDRGILILTAIEDRQIRIEVGYG
ncbi:MAG: TPM domain-containing protein, partial [Lentisphaerae bacterium]|nr:TPM domain-containing protein [Lentisphaerota bacterium]